MGFARNNFLSIKTDMDFLRNPWKKLNQPKNSRRNPRRVARSSHNHFLVEKTAFRVFSFCWKIAYTTLTLFRLFDDFLILSCFFTDFWSKTPKNPGFGPKFHTFFHIFCHVTSQKSQLFCPKPTRNFRFILRLLSSHFWREINLFSRNLKSVITQSISDSNFFCTIIESFLTGKLTFFHAISNP